MTASTEHDLHRMVLEALPLGVYAVNREGKVIVWVSGAERLTGLLRQDVLGRMQESDLLDAIQTAPLSDLADIAREPASAVPTPADTACSIRCKNGHYRPVHLRTFPLRDDNGKLLGAVKLFETDSPTHFTNRRQDKLGAYGCLDPVTGTLNHSMILAHLKERLSLHAIYPVPFCVICYGIDGLPKLAEHYGHAAVDATLRMVANTFESGLRPTDFLGRWLDGEFLAILPECGENDLVKVAERLRTLVQHAGLEWWGDTLHATISIGATMAYDNDTVGSLTNRAEAALRESYKQGGNRVVIFCSSGAF